jgi:hypothetical protein
MINSITNGFPLHDQFQQFPPVKQIPLQSLIGQISRLQLYLAPPYFSWGEIQQIPAPGPTQDDQRAEHQELGFSKDI